EVAIGYLRQADRNRVGLIGLLHLPRAVRAAQAVRRVRRPEVRFLGELVVRQLVVVRRRDVDDARRARGLDDSPHGGSDPLGPGDVELPAREHEVDLRVDVPEDRAGHRRYETSSSRSFGRNQRPTFAVGRPSVMTTSAVKSYDPRMSDDPTPYASTGTCASSNVRIFSAVNPPDATIFTRSNPSRSSASRTFRTSRSLTPRGSK